MNKKLVAASIVSGVALTLGSISGAVAHDGKGPRGAGISKILDGLANKGTLTKDQVDSIKKAMEDARTSFKAEVDERRSAHLKVITDTLGITEADLSTRLKAGETLAAIAGAKKDALIAALVAFHTKQIDDAVAAGKLTSERASDMKANLKDHVTKMVERAKGPKDGLGKGKKFGHKGGMGFGHGPRA
jgi:polyhydroxyalkanoate synthesis regulator phasin